MEKKLYSFKLKSHPDKLLKDHLINTAEYSSGLLKSKVFNFKNSFEKNDIIKIGYILGMAHDFGKSTFYFQKYLEEKDEIVKEKLKRKSETNHSLISAFAGRYLIEKFLERKNDFYDYIPLISFFIIKNHHGNLGSIYDEMTLNIDDYETVKRQLNSIDKDEINRIYLLNNDIINNLKFDFSEFQDFLNMIYNEKGYQHDRKLVRNLDKKLKNDLTLFLIIQLLYSLLINSDKKDVILSEKFYEERFALTSKIIEKYKKQKFIENDNRLNIIREKIYKDVIAKVDKINLEKDRIFSINVPTGTGKTLSSLSFALNLRERIQKEKGFIPKIIYSLPFLSIIDQNFDVIDDVLKMYYNKQKIFSNILLKHHHLSDIYYETEEKEYTSDESQFLIEGWKSEVIVTTFFQIFHSFITNKNRMVRKFHSMVNSIIILDEVQSIPHHYWLLVKEVFKKFSMIFNTYFVFITATQPLIFDEKENEIVEIVDEKDKYFNSVNRTKIILKSDNPITLDEFKEILLKDIQKNFNKDILIVLNTINSSIDIFQYIESLNLENCQLFYLSTNIIPKERLKRINQIRNSKRRKIIVSTQLIEAGVDIDVDIIYRDMAPFDSINQTAGRANRNFKKKTGTIYLFVLKDEKSDLCRYVYNSFILQKTLDLIEKYKRFNERDFFKLSNEYFGKLKEGGSMDEAEKILSYIMELKYDKMKEFKLIKDEYYKKDVFVEHDEYAKIIWKKFLKIRKIKNPFERKQKFFNIKKDFYDYVASVNAKVIEKDEFDTTGLVYISFNEIKNVYDINTGFKKDSMVIV